MVEDAAQAVGAEWRGQRAGSIGTIGCFSFFPTKNLGAFGDGGMLTTNDEDLARKLKALRIHGSFEKYVHQWAGMNSRLDALQAAVLDVKLDHLDGWNRARQRNAALYRELLSGVATTPAAQPHQTGHVFNQFVIRCERRDELRAFLAASGVGTEIYYPLPLHLQPALADHGYKTGDFPVERAIGQGGSGTAHIRRAHGRGNRHGGGLDPRVLRAEVTMHNRSVATLLAGAVLCVAADDLAPIPATPKKPVTDEYQGVQVVDDYRWLESSTDPQVRNWSGQQNARTRAYLDRLPSRAAIVERLNQLNASSSTSAFVPSPRYSSLISRGGMLFALKTQPPKRQPYLVALASPDDPDSARTVVDPNVLDPSGSTTIDFYEPSLDGKLVAKLSSRGGTEDGTVCVFEVAAGNQIADSVPRVNGATAGGSVAWNRDATGFWYSRYPREGERPAADLNFYQQVYFHRLGTPTAQDEYATGKQFPRIAEVLLRSSDDGKYVLARVANGDGGEFLHFMLLPDGQWHQITRFADHTSQATFGAGRNAISSVAQGRSHGCKVLALAPPTFPVSTRRF